MNQSQIECIEARNVLKICELKQDVANSRVTKLQSQLKSAIKASRYILRAECTVEFVFVFVFLVIDIDFSMGNWQFVYTHHPPPTSAIRKCMEKLNCRNVFCSGRKAILKNKR